MPKGLFLDDERNPQDVTWLQYPEDGEVVRALYYCDNCMARILGFSRVQNR